MPDIVGFAAFGSVVQEDEAVGADAEGTFAEFAGPLRHVLFRDLELPVVEKDEIVAAALGLEKGMEVLCVI